jgi:hypothetical protein
MTDNLPAFKFDPQGAVTGDVCIPNISPVERKKRAQFAAMQLFLALVVLGVLLWLDVNPLWRLLLFFMFSAATTSYFQALDKT